MCGICGFVPSRELAPTEVRSVLERMNGALTHRGPDDAGYHIAPNVGLAIRRLSIIDVAKGHQPMANEDGEKAEGLREVVCEAFSRFHTAAEEAGAGHLRIDVGPTRLDE